MKHKALALILCLTVVLTVALPGTLAVSMDAQTTTTTLTVDAGDKPPDVQPTETTAPQPGGQEQSDPEPPTEPTAPQKTEEETENETTETTAPSNQEENGENSTTEPTAPSHPQGENQEETATETPVPESNMPETTAPQCTCGTQDGSHGEGCGLYVKQEEEKELTLFEKLMATETLDAYRAVIAATTEEAFCSMTEEELAAIEAHFADLGGGQGTGYVVNEKNSNTVNYTSVAPLVDAA